VIDVAVPKNLSKGRGKASGKASANTDDDSADEAGVAFAPGQFELPPDDEEFTYLPAERTDTIGRVQGLDYEQWAAAVVDLDDDAGRVSQTRLRLAQKGYRQLRGKPIVGGFPNPEVWVIPRNVYQRRRDERHQRVVAMVNRGELKQSALLTGNTLDGK
jgi:hypothetical protein